METTRPNNSGSPSDSNPELDVAKLHSLPSEQQDLYLLTFTSDLVRHVNLLDADGASSHQIYIKKELFQIINLSSPPLNRIIRNNLGHAFAGIFAKGDRKLLFESINELTGLLGTGKNDKDIKVRHAATHCLGAIYEAAGDSAMSLSSLTIVSLLRQLKLVQTHTGFRAAIFKALGRIYKGVGSFAEEAAARDVWKQSRSAAATDKSWLVQTNACFCLEQLIFSTPYFINPTDFEKLQNVIWKVMDSSSARVRHSAASALSNALVQIYSESSSRDSVPRIKKPKKTSKKQPQIEGDDETAERPESPVPSKPLTRLSYGISDLLRQLSNQYCRPAISNRTRAGIILCYIKTLQKLGERVVEGKYSDIAQHFFNELLSSPSIVHNRHRYLTTRRYVQMVLNEVVGRNMLGETGQLNAAKILVNDILRDYPPSLKDRAEPNKHALTGALGALSSLIYMLGSATNTIAESCREGLIQVLQHPSYTVQVYASECLRSFVLACPHQLLPSITICMNSLNRELSLLAGPRQSPRRCLGLANGLAAALSTSTINPLFGSVDINSRVLSQATGLLKSSSDSDLRISSTQIQVAWILIGGLLTLGPNFVKIHLSQLLLLWKNALPRPLNKDNMTQRNLLELSFLAHVRECALGSILTFLEFNHRLLTVDVTKRLAAMLQSTTMFLNTLPARKTTDDITQRLSPALQLYDFDLMVRRRVLQCYIKLVNLSPAGSNETLLQTNMLPFAASCFAAPDNYGPSSLSASISNSVGSFETIWDVGDNFGFGVTGLVRGFEIKPLPGEHGINNRHNWVNKYGLEAAIDKTILSPICGALEHDSITLYVTNLRNTSELPDPPSTEVVNAAIQLFAISLPLQTPKVQESILEQVSSFLSTISLSKDLARKAAMTVNISMALMSTLKVAVNETISASGSLRGQPVEKVMQELLHTFITNPDQYIRHIASEALGRLCACAGNTFTTMEVKYLIDQIVSNREPSARSGCAIALGSIHSQLGGMAAGYHLKNILGILMSLANDPHPTVHFWALESISRVADSAGLSFSSYVSSTLGLLAQLYTADTHNEECIPLVSSNIEVELPSFVVIARCVDSCINVLGPDLQDLTKARELIMTLIGRFQEEEQELVLLESLNCLEHISLYAPGYMDFVAYVKQLQKYLSSDSVPLRDLSIDGLHNLMRRGSDDVIQAADPGLEEQLWIVLNNAPEHKVVKSTFHNWLKQTGSSATATWVQRCQSVLTRIIQKSDPIPPSAMTKRSAIIKSAVVPDLHDEEVAGFAVSAGGAAEDVVGAPASGQELLKWQVRAFATTCLSELLTIVGKDAAVREDAPSMLAIQRHIADVVRIAFSASTSGTVEVRLQGLTIIDQVLKIFGKTPDPDFAEATLLEQYQAQISSALTPAFAADSSPELAAAAINVCATFIATGIVTDVDRMGRILKLLVSALENVSRDSELISIGDLKGLTSNAQVMVKMAVFSAWAELQIASVEQKYLIDVLKPHIASLTPLWLSSLREYARLRFEPDISTTSGPSSLSGSLDTIYAALNRETLLKFYQDSWLDLVDAIASLIEEDSEFVFDALDGKIDTGVLGGNRSRSIDINYRDEPVAFFFVLFGLGFEALVGRPGDLQSSEDQTIAILQALRKILRPAVSGQAIYQEVVFSETMDMLDRLVLTEGLAVQSVIVEIARNLCLGHPSARKGQDSHGEEKLSEDIEQLFELTRIIILVLAGIVPNLTSTTNHVRHDLSDEAVNLMALALASLVDSAAVFPSVIKTDLHACILNIFTTILATGSCQAVVVPQSLPIFKRFVTDLARSPSTRSSREASNQLRGTLNRFLAILKQSQKREFDAAVLCEKNSILALTILTTSAGVIFDPSDPLVGKFIEEICDCLNNRMASKVAANCTRSLLLLPNKGPTESAMAAQLLPRLLSFLSNPSDIEGLEESRSLIAHALTSFLPTLRVAQIPTAMAIVIPALLARAAKEGGHIYKETALRLLDCASADQVAFRGIIGGMASNQKAFVEEIIKNGGVGASTEQNVVEQGEAQPAIALRMDFGA